MTWLRTREIKPGIYETQSAGRHAAGQLGIVIGILVGGILLILAIAALLSGDSDSILVVLFFGVPLSGIAVWHYCYNKSHPTPPRAPGPWD